MIDLSEYVEFMEEARLLEEAGPSAYAELEPLLPRGAPLYCLPRLRRVLRRAAWLSRMHSFAAFMDAVKFFASELDSELFELCIQSALLTWQHRENTRAILSSPWLRAELLRHAREAAERRGLRVADVSVQGFSDQLCVFIFTEGRVQGARRLGSALRAELLRVLRRLGVQGFLRLRVEIAQMY